MSEERLRDELEAMREEVERLPSSDPRKAQLEALAHDMQRHLDASDHQAALGLREQLEEAIRQYEATHPKLTSLINDVLVALAAVGI